MRHDSIGRGAARGRAGLRCAAAAAAAALGAAAFLGAGAPDVSAQGPPLTTAEIEDLIAECLHFAGRVGTRPDLTVGVVDPEGNALAVYHAAGVPADPLLRSNRAAVALAKAGTGAYFSSDQQTFSTRSAAFIIQDHFPPGVRYLPGGPLYGVEFSSIATSDVNPIVAPIPASFLATSAAVPVPAAAELRIRGDLGGIGLYKNGRRVGGLGVDDGDPKRRLTIPRAILTPDGCDDPYRLSFRNFGRGRDLERIVMAAGARFLAPPKIRATEITVDGIRLPFSLPTRLGPPRAGLQTPAGGAYDPDFPLTDPTTLGSKFVDVRLDPPPGSGPDAPSFNGQIPDAFRPRAGTDGFLTEADVRRMLWQGARQASITRAAIRRPIGVEMQCWISVVDTRGEVLGVFRFHADATLFSYDVAVQKARTAAFFSDDRVAFSCRGIGLLSQAFYPAGQQDEGRAPLFQLQDGITVGLLTGAAPPGGHPLLNGITIFPGGVPLYKGGRLAGGIGVSGDGVDQDDIVADLGSRGFGAPGEIRCDRISGAEAKAGLRRALNRGRYAALES